MSHSLAHGLRAPYGHGQIGSHVGTRARPKTLRRHQPPPGRSPPPVSLTGRGRGTRASAPAPRPRRSPLRHAFPAARAAAAVEGPSPPPLASRVGPRRDRKGSDARARGKAQALVFGSRRGPRPGRGRGEGPGAGAGGSLLALASGGRAGERGRPKAGVVDTTQGAAGPSAGETPSDAEGRPAGHGACGAEHSGLRRAGRIGIRGATRTERDGWCERTVPGRVPRVPRPLHTLGVGEGRDVFTAVSPQPRDSFLHTFLPHDNTSEDTFMRPHVETPQGHTRKTLSRAPPSPPAETAESGVKGLFGSDSGRTHRAKTSTPRRCEDRRRR